MLIPTQLFLIPFIEYFFLESDSRIDGSQILIMIFEDYYIVLKFIFHGLSGIFCVFNFLLKYFICVYTYTEMYTYPKCIQLNEFSQS